MWVAGTKMHVAGKYLWVTGTRKGVAGTEMRVAGKYLQVTGTKMHVAGSCNGVAGTNFILSGNYKSIKLLPFLQAEDPNPQDQRPMK